MQKKDYSMTFIEHSEKDIYINLLLTSICNAGCSWCIANEFMKNQHSSNKMSSENMEKILNKLENEKLLQVNLLGGEPSLHPDALDFGRKIHEKGNNVGLSTNAIWSNSFRHKFSKVGYPLEIEVTYLGTNHYSSDRLRKIFKTFEQLKGHRASIGIIIDSPQIEFKEYLDIAEKYGFDLRWTIVEPTKRSGLTEGYRLIKNIKNIGRKATEIIKEANKRGINTWADLTVPRCSVPKEELYLFETEQNDIQFKCPPFFDISPDLEIWRCLPLAEGKLPSLLEFDSFKQAYKKVNEIKRPYLRTGVFGECSKCRYLENTCSGGPTIAKKLKSLLPVD